jgi:hypothetical protein
MQEGGEGGIRGKKGVERGIHSTRGGELGGLRE